MYSDSEPGLWLNLTVAAAEPPVIVDETGLIYDEPFVVKDCVQSTVAAGVLFLAPAVYEPNVPVTLPDVPVIE